MAKDTLSDKKITSCLPHLTTRQKKTLLTVAKTFAEEQQEDDKWEDKVFVAEIDERFAEYETGKVKGVSLDEAEAKARKNYKNKKAGK